MKRSTFLKAVVPSFALTLTAASCGSSEAETAETYPTRPIQVIVAFSAGGQTDVGARQLMPLVEKELEGSDIQVVNQPGAGGWVGWNQAVNADPDGYTLAYLNTPNLVSGYMNPELGRDQTYEDFAYIANQVTDPGTISIRPDEDRFTDLESLIEYAKENPSSQPRARVWPATITSPRSGSTRSSARSSRSSTPRVPAIRDEASLLRSVTYIVYFDQMASQLRASITR